MTTLRARLAKLEQAHSQRVDWRPWALQLEHDLRRIQGRADTRPEPTIADLPATKTEYDAIFMQTLDEAYSSGL